MYVSEHTDLKTKTGSAKEIGVSAKSLNGFLGSHDTMKGSNFAAYGASRLLPPLRLAQPTSRRHQESHRRRRRRRQQQQGLADVVLEGEETDAVPIFDSCDEVRKRIDAQFCRDVYAQLKGLSKPGKCFRGVQPSRLRGMKGPYNGAKSPFYYGAYVLFEKKEFRIKEGKPKSKHRLDEWSVNGARKGALKEMVEESMWARPGCAVWKWMRAFPDGRKYPARSSFRALRTYPPCIKKYPPAHV
ncbi:hypothetical protein QBC44DRAFT_358522 [Cladorrhinum sp. PSN332]|nr:hypothetical protein QBC44DRAFT_358522 [Cladorrhinum sp. PSN332]